MFSTMLSDFGQKLKIALRNNLCTHCNNNPPEATGLFCSSCRQHFQIRQPTPINPPGFRNIKNTQTHAASQFNIEIKQLLYPYKFYQRHEHAPILAEILIDYWRHASETLEKSDPTANPLAKNTLVVPVPSRWSANHLRPIAQRFACDFGYAYNETLLYWERETHPQHTISNRKQRLKNIEHTMAVCPKTWEILLKERTLKPQTTAPHIIIIDDMTTTGATLHEASRALNHFFAPQTGYQTGPSHHSPAHPILPLTTLALTHVPRTN